MSALRSLSEGKAPQPARLIRSALRLEPCLRKSAALEQTNWRSGLRKPRPDQEEEREEVVMEE